MRLVDCEQGSPEWFAARLGKVTASRVADIVATTKTGYSTSRANYCAELVAERLTGARVEGYTNAAMQWGSDNEPAARTLYEMMTDKSVSPVGLVLHPMIDMAAASPDGLVGESGLVEIKCPNTATHIETLLGKPIDGKYIKQMQWQMACTGREWCDFVSYDPRMPGDMQIHIELVLRDNDLIDTLTKEVRSFLVDVETKIDALVRKFRREAA